jgi:hypothetical protein
MQETLLSITMPLHQQGVTSTFQRKSCASSCVDFFHHRYGIWYRAEISATGTSENTPATNPINIPVLESSGNVAHSNGGFTCVGAFITSCTSARLQVILRVHTCS